MSLEIFHRAGVTALREQSLQLTGYLEWLVQTQLADVLQVKEWDEDRQAAQALVERRPDEDKDLRLVPFAELARYELIIHKISQKVDLIEGRYRASMASDARGVERRKQAAEAEALGVRKATAWAKSGPFDREK